MDEQTRQIVKSMAEMARADGEISPEERALLIRVLVEAGAAPADTDDVGALLDSLGETSGEGTSLDLVEEDKRVNVMRALLIMSFMDGKLSFAEFTQIERRAKELNISAVQMEILRAEALEAANSLRSDLDPA